MKTSTQHKPEALWSSRRFDERVEFRAADLYRQPDFGPEQSPSRLRSVVPPPVPIDADESYARPFYGSRAEPGAPAMQPDEGLSDVVSTPKRSAGLRRLAGVRTRRH